MNKLFPAIKPYATHKLEVETPHVLHLEECGNPDGLPVLFLHGGPGAGCDVSQRQFFDPEIYRIILFDQRGSGRSRPHAILDGNHTQALIADIERLREFLDIEQWIVFGGSWGSTLGLLYAQAYPAVVLGMILRGIFLCRQMDIDWFYQDGASHVFPDYWQEYIQPVPKEERVNMVQAYYKRLVGSDELARMAAAKAWSRWEARCATLKPSSQLLAHMSDAYTALSMARIECHYFINHAFIEPGQILSNIDVIRHIPTTIIHGRYDMVCPVEQAYTLHQSWPEASLKIIPDAGHSAFEPGIVDALVSATNAIGHALK